MEGRAPPRRSEMKSHIAFFSHQIAYMEHRINITPMCGHLELRHISISISFDNSLRSEAGYCCQISKTRSFLKKKGIVLQ